MAKNVAPRVGAWIETIVIIVCKIFLLSPLAWGRGLKHTIQLCHKLVMVSPLAWGRGLKPLSV